MRFMISASGNINTAAIDRRPDCAARNRHTCPGTAPLIGGRIIFLYHGDVRGQTDERRADPPANYINLSGDDTNCGMVARSRHRASLAPRVSAWIVFLSSTMLDALMPRKHRRVLRYR